MASKKLISRIFLVLMLIFEAGKVSAQFNGIVINEILASNVSSDYDTITMDFPDWIELYNPGSSPASLGGCFLTNDSRYPEMWLLPNGVIVPAGGYILFWADEKDEADHTNFKLSKEKGFVGLYGQDGEAIDSFSYPLQVRDISYGRSPSDPGKLVYFTKTSKLGSNSSINFQVISRPPEVSPRGGFYTGEQTVELLSDSPSGKIFYTTNGSEPDSLSTAYSGPFIIPKTTALRARVIAPEELPGPVVTQTYLIDEPVNLPVISIVTDSANFFDDKTGIYVTGTNGKRGSCDTTKRNLNQDWERAVNIELYETDGSLGFNQEAGIKIYGGCSRTRFPQKSLALYARNSYGKGSFDYQLFPDKSIYHFDTFVLRSSADDQVRTFMRDALAQYIGIGMLDLDFQAYRPAVVFFDGVYWGIHNIREKINEHYIENNYSLDKSTLNILQSNYSVVYGSSDMYAGLISFISGNSLENTTNYNFVKSKIDIDQYIDYEILHIYLAERDWPGNNIKYWNTDVTGHTKWRWICFDLDQTFIRTTANTLADATAISGPSWPNPPWSTQLLRSLLVNSEFRNRFIQRYALYLSTIFEPAFLEKKVLDFRSVLESEMPRHIIRWGGLKDPDSNETWMAPTPGTMSQWLTNVDNLISFVKQRPSVAVQHIRSIFGIGTTASMSVQTNIENAGNVMIYGRKVPLPDFYGSFFVNIPILISAVPNPGYRFLRWEFKGSNTKNDTSSEVYFQIYGSQAVTAVFEQTGIEDPVVIINEINYNSSPDFSTGDWIELYNRQDVPVDISGWKIRDSNNEHEYKIPMATVLGGNGYLIVCEDIDRFTDSYNALLHSLGNMGFGFKSKGEVIRLYDSMDRLIDSVEYDNNNPWPEPPDGDGYSLILKQPDLNNDLAENWTECFKGTPGVRNDNMTGIKELSESDLLSAGLGQNYPNPSDNSTFFDFRLIKHGRVLIRVFDLNGNLKETIVNESFESGTYSFVLSTEEYRSGIYFCTMQVDDLLKGIRKFIVIH